MCTMGYIESLSSKKKHIKSISHVLPEDMFTTTDFSFYYSPIHVCFFPQLLNKISKF